MMYYLWRTESGIFYVTDYKEQKNGLTYVDGRGYLDLKYCCCSKVKAELWKAAEIIINEENNS